MDPKLVQAVQSIAQSLQSHLWPQSFADLAQVILFALTVVTLYYLRRYTIETVQIRVAARDQVEATNQLLKETQTQSEQSLMPMVILSTAKEADRGNRFVLKNAGNGPALNVRTSPMNLKTNVKVQFQHRSVIGSQEQEWTAFCTDSSAGSMRPANLVQMLKNEAPGTELQNSHWISGRKWEVV
jgi:hypothetical protein